MSEELYELSARITLKEDTGGALKRGFSGMRVNFIIGGRGSVCEITWPKENRWLKLGGSHNVTIGLPWGNQIKLELVKGATFELRVGSTVIGNGEISNNP
ncbi:MAG: hypothetical protein GY832_19970 [Chloroflexi bacterium]|nr:hypothetical protein [Chloroflexota bacterium]